MISIPPAEKKLSPNVYAGTNGLKSMANRRVKLMGKSRAIPIFAP